MRSPMIWLFSACFFSAGFLSGARAEGWRYYEPDKRLRFTTYEIDSRPGMLGPVTISCENFILKIAIPIRDPKSMKNPATFRIEGAQNIAVITGKLLQGEDGYFISNELAFGDRLFPLLEKGGYKIKNDRGEMLVEVKSSNPYLTDLVYNCRKGG
jgi:hypothetical protein